jgi:hypothetical protein
VGKIEEKVKQLREKEGATCFAVSLTPAIIEKERE